MAGSLGNNQKGNLRVPFFADNWRYGVAFGLMAIAEKTSGIKFARQAGNDAPLILRCAPIVCDYPITCLVIFIYLCTLAP